MVLRIIGFILADGWSCSVGSAGLILAGLIVAGLIVAGLIVAGRYRKTG
jgi:hypothetical protein